MYRSDKWTSSLDGAKLCGTTAAWNISEMILAVAASMRLCVCVCARTMTQSFIT